MLLCAAALLCGGARAQLNVPVPNNGFENPALAARGDAAAPAQWSTGGSAYRPLLTEFADAPQGNNVLRLQQGQSASVGVVRVSQGRRRQQERQRERRGAKGRV